NKARRIVIRECSTRYNWLRIRVTRNPTTRNKLTAAVVLQRPFESLCPAYSAPVQLVYKRWLYPGDDDLFLQPDHQSVAGLPALSRPRVPAIQTIGSG